MTVRVADWNGQPGRVEFNLNGRIRSVQASGDIATTTYDMGSDLQYALTGRWNELRITAYNAAGAASETQTIRWFGVSLPHSLHPANWAVGVGQNPRLTITTSQIRITFVVNWPHRRVDAAAPAPIEAPLMNNSLWGSVTNKFLTEVTIVFEPMVYPEVQLRGTATIRAGADVSLEYNLEGVPVHQLFVANFGWNVGAEVTGTFQFMPDFRLQSLSVGYQGGVTVQTPDLLPFIPYVNVLKGLLDLYGRFSASADGSILFADRGDSFGFREGALTIAIQGSLALSIDQAYREWITGEVAGGLRPSIRLEFPVANTMRPTSEVFLTSITWQLKRFYKVILQSRFGFWTSLTISPTSIGVMSTLRGVVT